MILGARQQKIYGAVKDLCRIRSVPPSARDISRQSGYRIGDVNRALPTLLLKGFVRQDRFGYFIANEPPHVTVLAHTLEAGRICRESLLGPSKEIRLVRARRIITRTLHYKHNYSIEAIAEVLHRHPTTVGDYIYTERTWQKAKARAIRFRRHEERVAT